MWQVIKSHTNNTSANVNETHINVYPKTFVLKSRNIEDNVRKPPKDSSARMKVITPILEVVEY